MYTRGIEQAWVATIAFIPNLLLALVIGIVGYFVARFLGAAIHKILHRAGFDRLVERGGVKQAMAKSGYDVSDVLGKITFWVVFLFVLQMAFSVFGPNPISDLITRMIAFLPNVFVAGLIVVITAAIAAGVKDIIQASLGGLSYGRPLAIAASIAIVTVGVFAALNQLMVAPAIVNGLFYAMLAIIAGSAIVAIGGGGIGPMREVWQRAIDNVSAQTPRITHELNVPPDQMQHRAREMAADMATPPMPMDVPVTSAPAADMETAPVGMTTTEYVPPTREEPRAPL